MDGFRPRIAIIDPNMLAMLGLRQLLQGVMPMMSVEVYRTFDEFIGGGGERCFHYFVAQSVVVAHNVWFSERRRKTLVLTLSSDANVQLPRFRSLCVGVDEETLVREVLRLVQQGHSGGRNLPPMEEERGGEVLSNREAEVLSLVVRGLMSKEIADRLHISLPTVNTHRKNICEKLGVKSVPAWTIYAVMHGYVDMGQIEGGTQPGVAP